jgi:hypothetical protein
VKAGLLKFNVSGIGGGTVVAAVTADGTVSFRIDATSTASAYYNAKEAGAALAPQLIVTVSSGIPTPLQLLLAR